MEAERAKRIKELQKEKDVVILAHYYVDGAVQEIADYVGDSFYLSKVATKVPQKTILFAGVTFMGESAKILNPDKTVVMADECADSTDAGSCCGLPDGTYDYGRPDRGSERGIRRSGSGLLCELHGGD